MDGGSEGAQSAPTWPLPLPRHPARPWGSSSTTGTRIRCCTMELAGGAERQRRAARPSTGLTAILLVFPGRSELLVLSTFCSGCQAPSASSPASCQGGWLSWAGDRGRGLGGVRAAPPDTLPLGWCLCQAGVHAWHGEKVPQDPRQCHQHPAAHPRPSATLPHHGTLHLSPISTHFTKQELPKLDFISVSKEHIHKHVNDRENAGPAQLPAVGWPWAPADPVRHRGHTNKPRAPGPGTPHRCYGVSTCLGAIARRHARVTTAWGAVWGWRPQPSLYLKWTRGRAVGTCCTLANWRALVDTCHLPLEARAPLGSPPDGQEAGWTLHGQEALLLELILPTGTPAHH